MLKIDDNTIEMSGPIEEIAANIVQLTYEVMQKIKERSAKKKGGLEDGITD